MIFQAAYKCFKCLYANGNLKYLCAYLKQSSTCLAADMNSLLPSLLLGAAAAVSPGSEQETQGKAGKGDSVRIIDSAHFTVEGKKSKIHTCAYIG